jgi:hypothetical protein
MATRNSATACSGVLPCAAHGSRSGASAIQTASSSDQCTMMAYFFIRCCPKSGHVCGSYREAAGPDSALRPGHRVESEKAAPSLRGNKFGGCRVDEPMQSLARPAMLENPGRRSFGDLEGFDREFSDCSPQGARYCERTADDQRLTVVQAYLFNLSNLMRPPRISHCPPPRFPPSSCGHPMHLPPQVPP